MLQRNFEANVSWVGGRFKSKDVEEDLGLGMFRDGYMLFGEFEISARILVSYC